MAFFLLLWHHLHHVAVTYLLCIWILPFELEPDSALSLEIMIQTQSTSWVPEWRAEQVLNKEDW